MRLKPQKPTDLVQYLIKTFPETLDDGKYYANANRLVYRLYNAFKDSEELLDFNHTDIEELPPIIDYEIANIFYNENEIELPTENDLSDKDYDEKVFDACAKRIELITPNPKIVHIENKKFTEIQTQKTKKLKLKNKSSLFY